MLEKANVNVNNLDRGMDMCEYKFIEASTGGFFTEDNHQEFKIAPALVPS